MNQIIWKANREMSMNEERSLKNRKMYYINSSEIVIRFK